MVYTPKTSPYNPWMTMVVVASTTTALAQWHTYVHLSLCVWILYSTFMGHWPLPKTRINWMQAASSLNLKYLVKGVSPGKKKHTHTQLNGIGSQRHFDDNQICSENWLSRIYMKSTLFYDTMLYYSLIWAWNFESQP